MNFERALALMKEVLMGQGYATSAGDEPGVLPSTSNLSRLLETSQIVEIDAEPPHMERRRASSCLPRTVSCLHGLRSCTISL